MTLQTSSAGEPDSLRLLPPSSNSAAPIAMAPAPAQAGMLTVCLSFTDISIGPIVISWVFFV